VAGEAGAGKTSLFNRFVASLDVHTLVITGACDPLATPKPLSRLFDFAAQEHADLTDLMERDPETLVVSTISSNDLRNTISAGGNGDRGGPLGRRGLTVTTGDVVPGGMV
jgi:predicted ATPase